jgi:hypothetical protein
MKGDILNAAAVPLCSMAGVKRAWKCASFSVVKNIKARLGKSWALHTFILNRFDADVPFA